MIGRFLCRLGLHWPRTAERGVDLFGNGYKLQYCGRKGCDRKIIKCSHLTGATIISRVRPDDAEALAAIAAHRQGSA